MLLMYIFCSCKNDVNKESVKLETNDIAYASFGDKITISGAISASEMAEQLNDMKIDDTLKTKVVAKINDVCSNKGCWMKLDLGHDQEMMVRFKDYGFFVPLDASGDAIINGKAYVSETSIEELRHYAKDAGKSLDDIEKIKKPQRTFSFEANGVLLKK